MPTTHTKVENRHQGDYEVEVQQQVSVFGTYNQRTIAYIEQTP